MPDIEVSFRNEPQRRVYYSRARNLCFSGGFNNGKTFIGCLKAITLLLTYPKYKVLICRQTHADLKKTTAETFYKLLPPQLIAHEDRQNNMTTLINGSVVIWQYLDKVDESTLRGLEINMVLVDQAEEVEEKVYDVLDARVGRWDGAQVPDHLLCKYPNWPKSPTGKYIVPSYHLLLCNPDTEFHWIFRKFHPESMEKDPDYEYISGEWDPNLGSEETYKQALKHDKEWVDRFVRGEWGSSGAAIHKLNKMGILQYSPELIEKIINKGNLFRALDHGDSSPTCCLWVAAFEGVYIFYREYYVASRVVSYHRRAISDLSGDEHYSASYADPQIFKKTNQKDGGFWSIQDEYIDTALEAPALHWLPADNNEFATRNRINELLKIDARFKHPVTGERPAIGMYFVAKGEGWPNGCFESIKQLGNQRRKSLGTIDGKTIFADDRDDKVTDHAYDPIRYFVAMHGTQPGKVKTKPKRNSFAYYNTIMQRHSHSIIPASASS